MPRHRCPDSLLQLHGPASRLLGRGQSLVTNPVTEGGTITLAARVNCNITLEYYENKGSASVRLEWASARQGRQVILTTQLYPPDLPPEPSPVP